MGAWRGCTHACTIHHLRVARVEVYDSDDLTAQPLRCLHGTCVQPTLTTRRYTRTSYHNAQPYMDDEIKIALPLEYVNAAVVGVCLRVDR